MNAGSKAATAYAVLEAPSDKTTSELWYVFLIFLIFILLTFTFIYFLLVADRSFILQMFRVSLWLIRVLEAEDPRF
jgi:hypothetical protein